LLETALSMIITGFIYLFVQSFLHDKRDIHILWKICTFIFVSGVRFPIMAVAGGDFWIRTIIMIAAAAVIGWVFFQEKPAIIATVVGLYCYVLVTLELIAINMVEWLLPDIAHLLAFPVTYLLLLISVFIIRRLKLGRMDFVTTRLGIAFCMLMMFFSFGMLQFVSFFMEPDYDFSTIDSLLWRSIVVANVLVIILIEILIRQNEKSRLLILQKFQGETQQNHITQLANHLTEKRLMSHDFKHSLEMIHTLFSAGKDSELRSYLSELSDNKPTQLTLDTGNVMVDAILTSKKAEAIGSNIDFTLNMDIPQGLPDLSAEICTLLGNALDNAIEACGRSSEKHKFINIEIKATMTQFLCRIVNTIGTKPKPGGKFLETSKPDKINHGIGLRSMKQTCDNLGGNLSFEYNDTQFELQIYIPISM